MAQEEMVRLHGHFDWMQGRLADVENEVDWKGSSPPYHLEAIRPEDFDIPILVNREVKGWMKYFLGPGRRTFETYLARSSRYESLIKNELKAGGVPEDLVYIAMIESGFVTDALSRSGASGLWQIMPGTARKYDVRMDGWVDDRLDPIRSTQAAVNLLKALKERWGDWYLVWAAYNGGGRRVKSGVEATGSRDFWRIAQAGAFAGETRNYVPKLIAATILGKYRDRYGFTGIPYMTAFAVDQIDLAGGARVEQLARCADLSKEKLKSYNPGLLRWSTPEEGYTLKVPKGRKARFIQCLAEEGVFRPVKYINHRVKNGEVLGRISEIYGVTQDEILGANGRLNPDRIRAGETLLIPVAAEGPLVGDAGQDSESSQAIEERGGVDADYTVEWGDTLSSIALRYGVRVGQLQTWNKLHPGATLQVGQRLRVILEARRWKEYTVRDGDSLGKIAYKYACTVKDLLIWNGLKGSFIRPGQRLRIRN